MLRITSTARGDDAVTLVLEGSIAGAWVDELRQVVDRSLQSGCPVSLDLARVDFVDRRGVQVFRSLRSRDVALHRCPGFIAELMRDSA